MRVVSKGVADVHRFIPVAVAMLAATAVGGLAGSASASENYVRCDMPTEHLNGKTYIDRITTTSSVCLKYDGQIIGPAHSTHPKPKPVSKSRSCPFAAGELRVSKRLSCAVAITTAVRITNWHDQAGTWLENPRGFTLRNLTTISGSGAIGRYADHARRSFTLHLS